MATLTVTERADLTDAQWAALEPVLPRSRKGRPPERAKRQLINGIRWRTWTGAPWRDVPPCYGPWQTVYGLFRRWQRNGTWRAILTALQARADAAGLITWDVSVDSTVARAHQHAAGARRDGDLQAEPPGGVQAAAAAGLIAGPRIRASVFSRSTESGQPPRRACPACTEEILPDRWPWRSLLPVTGRCPSCRTRIGPYPLLAELAAALALAVMAARASSVWELAALAWLVLLAVPLAFIDVAVRRLPDPLTAAAFSGTLVLLGVAALTGHQPGHLGRAAIGAVALACFYLILSVIRPGGLGLGDAKLAASAGAVLGWISWQALFTGTFAAFALARSCA